MSPKPQHRDNFQDCKHPSIWPTSEASVHNREDHDQTVTEENFEDSFDDSFSFSESVSQNETFEEATLIATLAESFALTKFKLF